ncbi:MAG TPA: sigma factor-like helix-turn-helix DNA-binding protein [Steroidobacteraceae bacterium]|jgi:RNA polymerase sigma-70 factor (ECF subfamily)|nr:sigma factor-like helix-turn-helix DNA-binding protein [Steroidobacteraceae bacterium]
MHMLETQSCTLDNGGTNARRPANPGAEPEALPDLLLIERARAADERAIEALLRRYCRRLFRVACSVLMDEERAEAAVFDACCAGFSDLGRYDLSGKFAAWLTRLAYSQARSLRRPSARQAQPPLSPPPVPVDGLSARQELEQLIGHLPEAFRTVYVLRIVEGISGIETAACLGLHETTVRTRLFRAHRRLPSGTAQRLHATPAVLEPSAACSERIVKRTLAQLAQGSMLRISASPP